MFLLEYFSITVVGGRSFLFCRVFALRLKISRHLDAKTQNGKVHDQSNIHE